MQQIEDCIRHFYLQLLRIVRFWLHIAMSKMTEPRDRSRSPKLPRCIKTCNWWTEFLGFKVKSEGQILSVSNALEDAKNERWDPPDSSSRAGGFNITIGSDAYNYWADILWAQSDTDLKMFETAFMQFQRGFSFEDSNDLVNSEASERLR
jgi:hypothetical protein